MPIGKQNVIYPGSEEFKFTIYSDKGTFNNKIIEITQEQVISSMFSSKVCGTVLVNFGGLCNNITIICGENVFIITNCVINVRVESAVRYKRDFNL